jgi:hypothetical protein
VRALLLSVRLCPAVTGSQRPSVPNTCRRSVLVQRVLDAAFGGGVLALAALGLAPLSRFGAQRRRLPVEPCRGRRLVGAAIGAAWPSGEAYSSSLTRYPARGPTPTRKRWSPPRRRAPRARTKLLCCSSQAAESRSCSICPSATYPPPGVRPYSTAPHTYQDRMPVLLKTDPESPHRTESYLTHLQHHSTQESR